MNFWCRSGAPDKARRAQSLQLFVFIGYSSRPEGFEPPTTWFEASNGNLDFIINQHPVAIWHVGNLVKSREMGGKSGESRYNFPTLQIIVIS